MDRAVLKAFKTGARSAEAVALAGRYISAVYFFTLFLFATIKARHYDLQRTEGDRWQNVELIKNVPVCFVTNRCRSLAA